MERVRERGGKVTSQRVLIYQALMGDTSHPTAEQLHARLARLLPHLSLTTVYAALNDLADAGELRRFQAGDGQVHFDPDTRPHAEVVCVRCRRIEDAPEPHGRHPLPAEVAGFRILGRTELLHGLCPECTGAEAAARPAEADDEPEDAAPGRGRHGPDGRGLAGASIAGAAAIAPGR